MSEIRLHLDEDAEAHALVQALRGRGVDVTTTSESNLIEASDEAQLVRATREGRVLLTYNVADFCRLHTQFIREARHHHRRATAPYGRQDDAKRTALNGRA